MKISVNYSDGEEFTFPNVGSYRHDEKFIYIEDGGDMHTLNWAFVQAFWVQESE